MELFTFIILIILFALVVLSLGYLVYLYNRIIRKENQIDNAYGSIQANLKKRHDLIPNLVSAAQKYMDYESSTLKDIVDLRYKAQSGDLSRQEQEQVESKLSKALNRFRVQVEDYPDLKASDNFMQLQRSLNEVEEQLSASRRFFNSAVKDYNNSIETFPAVLIANNFGFEQRQVFEADVQEQETPDVSKMFDS